MPGSWSCVSHPLSTIPLPKRWAGRYFHQDKSDPSLLPFPETKALACKAPTASGLNLEISNTSSQFSS